MADKKISELTLNPTINGSEEIAEERGGSNYKNTLEDVKTFVKDGLNTSEVTETTDKKYVTDAEKVVIGNTSGTNTGDQDLSGLQPILSEGAFVDGDKTKLDNQSGTNTGDETTSTIQTKRPLKTLGGTSLEGSGDVPLIEKPIIDDSYRKERDKTSFVESKIQQYKRDNSPEILTLDQFDSLKEYSDKIYSVRDIGTYFGSSLISENLFTYSNSDIHVKKTGNDSTGSGTEANPYLTIDKAIDSTPTLGGLNIWVYEGIYEENSQSIGYLYIENKSFTNKVSIKRVNNQSVIVKGQSGAYACRLSGNCDNIEFSKLRIETISGNSGLYTHTSNSPISNCGFIDCEFVDNYSTALSIASDSTAKTDDFYVKRCKFFSDGDFRTYFSNNVNLDFIGNVYSSTSSVNPKVVRIFSGCGGNININSNTIDAPNFALGWVLDFDTTLDYPNTVININSNTIKCGSRAIQVIGGTETNPVEVNIKDNEIEAGDTGITINEYIDGGLIERNVIRSNGAVGIGAPTDAVFTSNFTCKNQTIRYNIVSALGVDGHALLLGERSSNQNCYSNILDASLTGKHGVVIKGSNHIVNDNLIYGGSLDCIYFKGSNGSTVKGNTSQQATGGSCIRYSDDGSGNLPINNVIERNDFLATIGQIMEVFAITIGDDNKQNENIFSVVGSATWGNMFGSPVNSLGDIESSWALNYVTNPNNDSDSYDESYYYV